MPSPLRSCATKRGVEWNGDAVNRIKRICKIHPPPLLPVPVPQEKQFSDMSVPCEEDRPNQWKRLRGIIQPEAGPMHDDAEHGDVQVVAGRDVKRFNQGDISASASSITVAVASALPKRLLVPQPGSAASSLQSLPGAATLSTAFSSPTAEPKKTAESNSTPSKWDEAEWGRMFRVLQIGGGYSSQRSDPVYAAASSNKQSPIPKPSIGLGPEGTQASLRRFFKPLPGAPAGLQHQSENPVESIEEQSPTIIAGFSPVAGLQECLSDGIPVLSPVQSLQERLGNSSDSAPQTRPQQGAPEWPVKGVASAWCGQHDGVLPMPALDAGCGDNLNNGNSWCENNNCYREESGKQPAVATARLIPQLERGSANTEATLTRGSTASASAVNWPTSMPSARGPSAHAPLDLLRNLSTSHEAAFRAEVGSSHCIPDAKQASSSTPLGTGAGPAAAQPKTSSQAPASKDIRSFFAPSQRQKQRQQQQQQQHVKKCPICNCEIMGGAKEVNAHIDSCLSMADMEEL